MRGRTFIITRLLGHQLTMQRKRKGCDARPDCGVTSLSHRPCHLIRLRRTCHRTYSPSLSALTRSTSTCERCLFLTCTTQCGLVSSLAHPRTTKIRCNYHHYGKTQFRLLPSPTQDHLASIFTPLLVSENHPYILIIGLMADSAQLLISVLMHNRFYCISSVHHRTCHIIFYFRCTQYHSFIDTDIQFSASSFVFYLPLSDKQITLLYEKECYTFEATRTLMSDCCYPV